MPADMPAEGVRLAARLRVRFARVDARTSRLRFVGTQFTFA